MFTDNWESLYEEQDAGVATVLKEHPEVKILFERRHKLPLQVDINNVNPILHVLMEGAVEKQLQDPDFPEVKATIERLESKGLGRHAARACVTRLFIKYFYEVLSKKKKFDEDRYKHQLGLLGTDLERVRRNEPCPCGSGMKFKHCCMDMTDGFKVSRLAGALCLGHGIYMFGPYESIVEEPLDPILQLENRGHIAAYLEEHGDIRGARQSLEENVVLAESFRGGELLMNALQDLELLCINHQSLRENGITIAERLVALAESDDERGSYWCDKADLLARIGKVEEGAQEFHRLLDTFPNWHFGRYRYALFLEENGGKEDALVVLEELVAANREIDGETYQLAHELLKDWKGV